MLTSININRSASGSPERSPLNRSSSFSCNRRKYVMLQDLRALEEVLQQRKAATRTSLSSGSSLHSSLSFPEPKLRPFPDWISSTMSCTGLWMQANTESGFRSLLIKDSTVNFREVIILPWSISDCFSLFLCLSNWSEVLLQWGNLLEQYNNVDQACLDTIDVGGLPARGGQVSDSEMWGVLWKTIAPPGYHLLTHLLNCFRKIPMFMLLLELRIETWDEK